MANLSNYGIVTIPQGGTTSNTFDVPEGATIMGLFIPILEAATTVALQATPPKLQVNEADAFITITVFDLTDGTFEALDGMGGAAAAMVTIPVSATGPGPLRFLASGAQATAAREIRISFWE